MSFSNYFETAILTHIFGGSPQLTPLTNVYVGLSTSDPGEAGSPLDEPTIGVNSYARINIPVADLIISGNTVSNSILKSFPISTGPWSSGTPITHFFIADGDGVSPEGNILGSGGLGTTRIVDSSDITLSFGAGDLSITLN